MKVSEAKRILNLFEDDEDIKLSLIVDITKLTEDDLVGEKEGVYFVDAEILDIDIGGEDENPTIYAHDVNYDGRCDEE